MASIIIPQKMEIEIQCELIYQHLEKYGKRKELLSFSDVASVLGISRDRVPVFLNEFGQTVLRRDMTAKVTKKCITVLELATILAIPQYRVGALRKD